MKASTTIILALASLLPVTLAAPVDIAATSRHISDLPSDSSEQQISEEIDFANEPNNELTALSGRDSGVLKRRRFVPATVLESRSKQRTTMSDLIDFASEPGQELGTWDDATIFKRESASAAKAAKVEAVAAPERRAKSDNDFYDNNWGFGEPSDHITESPGLGTSDQFPDPGLGNGNGNGNGNGGFPA